MKCSQKKEANTEKEAKIQETSTEAYSESVRDWWRGRDEEILSVSYSEDEISAVDNNRNKIQATMNIGGKEVKMLIDSGALCNVLLVKHFPKGTVVEKLSQTLKMYSKSPMSAIVKASQRLSLVNPKNKESYLIDFIIVDCSFAPLLGLESAQQMKQMIVQTQNIFSVKECIFSSDIEKPKCTKDAVRWWVARTFPPIPWRFPESCLRQK